MSKDYLIVHPITCKTVTSPTTDVDLPIGAIIRETPTEDSFLVVSPDTLADKVVAIDVSKHPHAIKRKPSIIATKDEFDSIESRLKTAIAQYTDLPVVRLKNMKVIRDLGPSKNWGNADTPAWLHKINTEIIIHPSLVVEPFLKGNERHLGLVYHHLS
jgi:hypothetical protein